MFAGARGSSTSKPLVRGSSVSSEFVTGVLPRLCTTVDRGRHIWTPNYLVSPHILSSAPAPHLFSGIDGQSSEPGCQIALPRRVSDVFGGGATVGGGRSLGMDDRRWFLDERTRLGVRYLFTS